MSSDARALETRFNVACAIAREAGEIAKRRFLDRGSFTVGFKGPQDYLTEGDGEGERLIAMRLHRLFPEDAFIQVGDFVGTALRHCARRARASSAGTRAPSLRRVLAAS